MLYTLLRPQSSISLTACACLFICASFQVVGSFGHTVNDAAPSTSTDVVVATPARAFGTSSSQYRGVATAAGGGGGGGGSGGSSPLSSPSKTLSKPSSTATSSAGEGNDRFGVRSGVSFDQTRALPKSLLDKFLLYARLSLKKALEEGLPEEVFKCVSLYSGMFYEVNTEIREFGMESLSLTQSVMCKNIMVAMEALPMFTSDSYYVYRAIRAKKQEDALLFKDLLEKGQPYVERAFLSTTLMHIESPLMKYFNDKNCYFAIRSKTGRHILQELTSEEEMEVVFRPGTSFRILSFEDTMPGRKHGTGPSQAGRYRIVMEEI